MSAQPPRSALRLATALLAWALMATAAARSAEAQCARQSACPSPCTLCRVPPASGTDPTVAQMSSLFDQIAAGPSVYGTLGWDFGTRTTISMGNAGCGGPIPRTLVPAHFPCILLKAIFLTETGWRQFCSSNLTVIAFDCGYGIAQVTSGMRPGNTSAFDPDRVASSPAYNVSVGAAILRDKWLASPCVGSNDPDVIEHWYFATWGYNGFAYSNNPNNPMFDAARAEFRTPGVASAQVRANYPYQEVVWGYAHYPSTAAHYTGIGLAYPERSQICASCASPTASITEPAGAHRSTCPSGVVVTDAGTYVDAAADAAPLDAGAADVLVADVSGDVSRDNGAEPATTAPSCGCGVPGRAPISIRWLAVLAVLGVAVRRGRVRRVG